MFKTIDEIAYFMSFDLLLVELFDLRDLKTVFIVSDVKMNIKQNGTIVD
jgi:hypothetical protein